MPLVTNQTASTQTGLNQTVLNQRKTPSRLQRFFSYQPSSRVAKVLFVWWLLVCLCSALRLAQGFGVDGLTVVGEMGLWFCMLGLFVLVVLAVFDVLCLVAISQPSHYDITRQHPTNVPVFHHVDIDVVLAMHTDFYRSGRVATPSVWHRLANAVTTMRVRLGLIKQITVLFYDDYPSQVMPIGVGSGTDSDTSGTQTGQLDGMPIRVVLPIESIEPSTNNPNSQNSQIKVDITYPVLATKRGTGYFTQSHLKVISPLGWFTRQFTLVNPEAGQQHLRVLVDFSNLLSNDLSAVFEKSVHAGVQALLKQGQGSDFLRLREYAVGDAIRQIDWKASSRIGKLMSKAFDDDNDQDVVFLLDCGEQMRHHDVVIGADEALEHTQQHVGVADDAMSDAQSHHINYFDRVLNAVLLLSYVANRQGDAVGLMTFAGKEVFLPPSKGKSLIRNLLNETADLYPSMQTSDYVLASQNLLKRLKKRALIVVISNTRTEASGELSQAMQLLSARHQVVFANLTEQAVDERLHGNMPPQTFDDALLYHSLVAHERTRTQLHQRLHQKTGAICLQVTAQRLPMRLIQTYLSIKR